MLRNNKGITLSALVITIIVLMIIASVASISGISATHYMKFQNAKSQIQVVQSKIDSLYSEYNNIKDKTEKEKWKNDKFAGVIKYSDFATKLDNSLVMETLNGLTIDPTTQDDYMYLSKDFIKNNLQIDGISYNFIVNLDEREVRIYGGVEYQNGMYYSAKDFSINIVDYDGKIGWSYKEDTNGKRTIVTDGKIELPIGTYINYNAVIVDAKGTEEEKTITSEAGSPTATGYYNAEKQTLSDGNGAFNQTFSNKSITNGWRVLGVNEETEELLIISVDTIQTNSNSNFYLRGIAGYNYGEQELNKVCSVFGNGYGATGARSVNINDINKVTGYNPNNVGKYDSEQKNTGIKYGKNESYEYQNKTTYSWTATSNQVAWKGTNEKSGTGTNNYYAQYGFNWYDITSKKWNNSMQNVANPIEITTLTAKYYWYYPWSLSTSDIENKEGISKTSEEYKMLFMNKAGIQVSYWLASKCVDTYPDTAYFGLYLIYDSGYVRNYSLYYSNGHVSNPGFAVRPVVSLKADIKLEKQDDGSYNIK